jgi:DNA-binding MltR family transcriptional regulator
VAYQFLSGTSCHPAAADAPAVRPPRQSGICKWKGNVMVKGKISPIEELCEESQALFEVMYEEPDMACVLIATSYLEQTLASLLERFFIRSDTAKKLLDSRGGALGNFQSRSDVSYCLGLIPKSLYRNLCVVGEIRNKFAHSYLSLNLDDPEIVPMIESLTFPIFKEVVTAEGREYNQDFLTSRVTAPREKFKLIVVMMVNRLLLTGLSVKRRCRQSKGWA